MRTRNIFMVIVLAITMLFSIAAAPIPAPTLTICNGTLPIYGYNVCFESKGVERQATRNAYFSTVCTQIDGNTFGENLPFRLVQKQPDGSFNITSEYWRIPAEKSIGGEAQCTTSLLYYIPKDKAYSPYVSVDYTIP
jgi:hypothetical protein